MKVVLEFLFLLSAILGVHSFGGDNLYGNSYCNNPKTGICPQTLINPSFMTCDSDSDCAGSRRCCLSTSTAKYCTDVAGSKAYLTCPPYVNGIGNVTRCVADANCGQGNLKCCYSRDYGNCNSYCVQGTRNCFSIPSKPYDRCPRIESIVNSSVYCSNNDQCPGNDVCCDTLASGRKCTAPRSMSPGSCPSAAQVTTAGTLACFSDKDCDTPYEKCCKFDSCNYFCSENLLYTRKGRLNITSFGVLSGLLN